MTACAPRQDSFRLLDARTGWEVEHSSGLVGFDDPAGLRLAPPLGSADAVHVADLAGCLLPARLAVDAADRLLRAEPDGLRVLDQKWRWRELALPDPPVAISSLGFGHGLLAVADHGARRVDLLRGMPLRQVLRIPLRGRPRLVAVVIPWSLVAVVTDDPLEVLLVGMDGLVRVRRRFPEAGRAAELGMARPRGGERVELLLAVRVQQGWRRVLRLDPTTLAATLVPPSALRCGQPAAPIEVGDDETWRLEPGDDPPVPAATRYSQRGELRTLALDSGLEDCRWHRVRVDADQPAGTLIGIRAATLTDPSLDPVEHDWRELPTSTLDALLVGLAPGRYLRLELTLTGDGRATPVVREVRADFDVTTSLDSLPAVYHADERAAEFTGRFLSLFDASLGELDEVIGQAPLLLDADRLPDHVLPALAARLGIRADPSWTPAQLRRLLRAWPEVAPLLGTPEGLRGLVRAVHGVEVLVSEPGRARPWGAAGQARLGEIRLFGLERASLRLGTGRLGHARVEPHAYPLVPAYGSGAWHCVVQVPASLPAAELVALEALVRTYLPVHVSVSVRPAAAALCVGSPLAVGVGTRIGRLAPGVLCGEGESSLILGRRGPLGACRDCGAAVTVGRRSVAGITT
jgi:phage tail-like protein